MVTTAPAKRGQKGHSLLALPFRSMRPLLQAGDEVLGPATHVLVRQLAIVVTL